MSLDIALTIACYLDSIKVASITVEKGANLDLQDDGGETALMLACYKNRIEIVAYILSWYDE